MLKIQRAGSAFVLLLFAGGVFTVLHFTKKSPPSPPPVVQEKKTSSSGVPVLIPPREDSTKLDARLRTEWADLKKKSAMLSPERKIREFRTFMERNNLQESLLQEVQREMAHARLEIRRRRRAAAAYAEEIAVFLSLTRFAPFLDRDSIRNLNRLAAGIERKGKLPHLRRVHAGRSKELAVSAAILKMRQNGLDALNGLPYPLKAEEKKTPQKSSSARAEQRRGDKSSGKSAGKKSAPSSVKRKSPAAVAEKEFIDIIARQVRNFEPDVLRMQLTGFARKYRVPARGVAEKADLIAKMLLEGDALIAFFHRCNESLKGIPLPEFEQNASYVIVERNSIRIMVVDGRVTIRKRLRLVPSLVSALKLAVYRAYLNESFRKKYSAKLQEYVIVNSFFYDNRHAARNIDLSTLPEGRKKLLRSILADLEKAVKQATPSF